MALERKWKDRHQVLEVDAELSENCPLFSVAKLELFGVFGLEPPNSGHCCCHRRP